ncbi:BTB/POZ protein [Rhizophagus irregularis DAOM 181602=DAOM 197198]|nr:BTB/POZ protein [Rhizophagus irregularis DAOM 181602=DAOM 197198]
MGIAQNSELSSDLSSYSKDDFNTLIKNTLQQFIPLIKFYNLTPNESVDKVYPHKKSYPKNYEEKTHENNSRSSRILLHNHKFKTPPFIYTYFLYLSTVLTTSSSSNSSPKTCAISLFKFIEEQPLFAGKFTIVFLDSCYSLR